MHVSIAYLYKGVDDLKIAIDTIIDYFNYGNRLQNYALQHVLENLGHDVITIKNVTDMSLNEDKKSRTFRLIKEGHYFDRLYRKTKKYIANAKQSKKYNDLRAQNFISFTKNYIQESEISINQDTTNFDFDKQIDCYVVGSDQVWNCNFFRFSSLDFISYSSKPKISYAASFGVDSVPENYRDVYQRGLDSFAAISVREDAGKQLVETLSEMNATVVLDPTLLLSKAEWLQLVQGCKKYSQKYILTYFFGNPTREELQYISKMAKQRNCEIKRLATYSDLELWVADPAEFVNLFSQAEAVYTDSFHACVFSIIFGKEFEAFSRNYGGPSMNSRLDTLFDALGLENRWYQGKTVTGPINYQQVYPLLEIQKQKSLSFLKSALAGAASHATN